MESSWSYANLMNTTSASEYQLGKFYVSLGVTVELCLGQMLCNLTDYYLGGKLCSTFRLCYLNKVYSKILDGINQVRLFTLVLLTTLIAANLFVVGFRIEVITWSSTLATFPNIVIVFFDFIPRPHCCLKFLFISLFTHPPYLGTISLKSWSREKNILELLFHFTY